MLTIMWVRLSRSVFAAALVLMLIPGIVRAKAPAAASVTETRIVLQQFVDAYNRHDLASVRTLLDSHVLWYDCDYARSRAVELDGKRALTRWLRAQFARGDQLRVTSILAGGWANDTVDPGAFGLLGTRTNNAIEARGLPPQPLDGSKGVLNTAGTRIAYYLLVDLRGCERPQR